MPKIYPMNLQLFAQPGEDGEAAEGTTPAGETVSRPDGNDNQPPAPKAMTQEEINKLINAAFARGAASVERRAREENPAENSTAPSDGQQSVHEIQAALDAANNRLQDAAIVIAATQAGFVDPTDAPLLVDRSAIGTDEQGNVTGAKEAVEALAKAKTHLVKPATAPPPVGGGVNSGNRSSATKLPGQAAAERRKAQAQRAKKAAESWENR